VPLQPPDAAHEVALVELHVNVEAPAGATTDGYTESVAVGTTFTVAVAGALVPPAPEQISEYVVCALTGPVACVPLAASEPVHPPEAVQDTALLELQVNIDWPPADTVVGAADKVAVGTGRMTTDAVAAGLVPPTPVHTSE